MMLQECVCFCDSVATNVDCQQLWIGGNTVDEK